MTNATTINLAEYQKPCACAEWTAALSTIVFTHKPGCPHFDAEMEMLIMADKLRAIHLEKFEQSINKFKGGI